RLCGGASSARHLRALLVVHDEGGAPAGDAGARSPARTAAGPLRVERFGCFVARQSPTLEVAGRGPDDLAGWLFTSGSTGKPKAAVHMHQDFRYNIERYAREIVQYRETDI